MASALRQRIRLPGTRVRLDGNELLDDDGSVLAKGVLQDPASGAGATARPCAVSSPPSCCKSANASR